MCIILMQRTFTQCDCLLARGGGGVLKSLAICSFDWMAKPVKKELNSVIAAIIILL